MDINASALRTLSLVLPAASLLCACATGPGKGVDAEQIGRFRDQGLTIGKVKAAQAVQVKTKGQAIGSAVIGSVVGSVAASNPSSISPQGMQQAAEFGATAGAVTQRAIAGIGQAVKQVDTPANAMVATITRELDELPAAASPAYRIDIHQTVWVLDFDSLFGKDNYRLHWELRARVLDAQDKVVASSQCKGDGDEKQALDSWKADDYAKVKAAALAIGERCAGQFLSDIGLAG